MDPLDTVLEQWMEGTLVFKNAPADDSFCWRVLDGWSLCLRFPGGGGGALEWPEHEDGVPPLQIKTVRAEAVRDWAAANHRHLGGDSILVRMSAGKSGFFACEVRGGA